MPVIARFTLMPVEPKGVIRIWAGQKGINTKIHLAVDVHGIPVRIFITQGTTADCTQAGRLIEGISADYLLADRGYDSNAIIEQAEKQAMEIVIPPRRIAKCKALMIKNYIN